MIQSQDGAVGFGFSSRVTCSRADQQPVVLHLSASMATAVQQREDRLPGLGSVRIHRFAARDGGILAGVDMAHGVDGRWAVRVTVENAEREAISLLRFTPLSVLPGTLRLGGAAFADWTFFRQPRHKNDMPAAIRLGDTRPGVLDAIRGTPETGGPPQGSTTSVTPKRFISSEAIVLAAEGRALCLGVYPAHEQLASTELQISEDRNHIEIFDVHLETDGQSLPPGTRMASQWVVVDLERDAVASLKAYAQTLVAYHGNPNARTPDTAPPTVWCSWYYYGPGCTERELAENLTWLQANPLPMDVVLIDDCWESHWGDGEPNADWSELPAIAARVRALGYQPGIWSCPFLAEPRSRVVFRNPHWLLRNAAGVPIRFEMTAMRNLVLDPTHPGVQAHLEALFSRMTRVWGFTYHKLDFTRAVTDPSAVFHDRTKNRAQAYRLGIEAIRRGMGPDSYLNICGGLYGAALGLANAQRTGSDVKSLWPTAPAGQSAEGYGPFTIKQNTLRFWLNDLGHNDPDALMVRRRTQAYRDEELSLGLLTDDEALTSTLNQYLGGGLICFSERLGEVDPDRLLLLRHCSPSLGSAAVPLDALSGVRFPGIFLTRVQPRCTDLGHWLTLSFVNWSEQPRRFSIPLAHVVAQAGDGWPAGCQRVVASSFRDQRSEILALDRTLVTGEIPPHSCEVLKIQPHRLGVPLLLHLDGHFSMGAAEVSAWKPSAAGVDLEVNWPWACPLRCTVGIDRGTGFTQPAMIEIASGSGRAGAMRAISVKL